MYQRIISLVPSQTELLFDLGLNDRIIGVTKYCIHPPEAQQKTRVGGTKTLSIDRILALKPDLILGNIEENTQAQIEMLRLTQNVVMSDIYTLADALAMIQHVGALTGTSEKASEISAKIQVKFSALRKQKNENKVNPVNPAILSAQENPVNPAILSEKNQSCPKKNQSCPKKN